MRTEPPRILFYSHDGHGPGHLRTTLALAEEFARRDPTAAILIATGAQALDATRLPDGIEFVKLPSVRASAALAALRPVLGSGYARHGPWAVREALLHETARTFDPHLVVVDNEPAGMQGELARTLRLVRNQTPRAGTVLGMNDWLGDPDAVRRRWQRGGGLDALAGDYDRVLVFGQPDVFDPRDAYAFPGTVAAATRFPGYLWRGHSLVDAAAMRARHGISATEPWLVVATDGGEEGCLLRESAIDAAAGGLIAARVLLLTGSSLPPEERERLAARATAFLRLSLVAAIDDLPALFAAADAVVITGGYDSVVEAIGAGKRPVIVPRDDAWTEQQQRADRLAGLGLATCIPPAELTPGRLAAAVAASLSAQSSPPPLLNLDGVGRAVEELLALLPSVSDRWPPRALPAATLPAPHVAPSPPAAVASGTDRIVAAWDGTLFHRRPSDLIEEQIAQSGAFERDVQHAIFPWLRPGDVVVDAGANVGCHACPMAIRVAPHGRVIAIEPVDRLADRLEANCRINGLANVDVLRVAVSSASGRRRLVVPPLDVENQGEASFHRKPRPTSEVIDVKTTTIDLLAAGIGLTSVRLLKTDLEGEDLPALIGARRTLRRFRPIVAFEYHADLWKKAGHTLADAGELLTDDLGYQLIPLPANGEAITVLALP